MATYQSMKIASDAKSVEEKRHQERKKALCVPCLPAFLACLNPSQWCFALVRF